MRHAIAVLLSLVAATTMVPAAGAAMYTAPGRTIFDAGIPAPRGDVDEAGASVAVALPDGGAVLAARDRGHGIVASQTDARGALDPTFGTGGVAHIAVGPRFLLLQALRQPDGRLLFVGTTAVAPANELPWLAVVRVNPNGTLDEGFGQHGVAQTNVAGACASCEPAALQPSGWIVLTGTTSSASPEAGLWVAMRLTPDGLPDSSFGTGGTEIFTGVGGQGFGVQAAPDGSLVFLGRDYDARTYLAGDTPNGKPDPAFHRGFKVAVPLDGALNLLRHPSGAIDVLAPSDGTIVRVTPAGDLDTSFGSRGSVRTQVGGKLPAPTQMLAAPDDGTFVYSGAIFVPVPAADPPLTIQHVDASGHLGAVVTPPTQFGGGFASSAGASQIPTTALAQNGFSPGKIVQRPDGSYLVAGGVRIVRYTGEGEGFSAGLFATAALDAAFAPIASYGGLSSPAGSSARVPRQSARSDAQFNRVLVRVTASQPGLMLLRVRDGHRRILAQSLEPIYKAGATNVRIPLTATGRAILGRSHGLRVLVGRGFRGVTTGGYDGQTAARLR